MLSVISMVTVRLALLATPGFPIAVSSLSCPWPPAWVPPANAALDIASAAIKVKGQRVRVIWVIAISPGLNESGSVVLMATAGFAHLHFRWGGRFLDTWHGLPAFRLEAGGFGQWPGVFVRHRALRVLEPPRIAVVTRLLVTTYLKHPEHAAHLDRSERALAGHHGRGVVRNGHFHLGHVGHATLAHHHVVRNQGINLLGDPTMINSDERGHVVANGIHGVVALVAVEGPVAFLVGEKFDLPHLADRDIGGDLVPASALGSWPAICASDEKLVPVQVDRVVGHRQVADTNANLVVQPHIQ